MTTRGVHRSFVLPATLVAIVLITLAAMGAATVADVESEGVRADAARLGQQQGDVGDDDQQDRAERRAPSGPVGCGGGIHGRALTLARGPDRGLPPGTGRAAGSEPGAAGQGAGALTAPGW